MQSIDTVLRFLEEVDHDFPVSVSSKTPLDLLAKKYIAHATLCCEYSGDRIIAMVAGYLQNTENQVGYISLVAARRDARRKGLCTKLLMEFLNRAASYSLKGVHVYTHKTNEHAIEMYLKLGFEYYYPQNEPRPDDIHLIYYIDYNQQNKTECMPI